MRKVSIGIALFLILSASSSLLTFGTCEAEKIWYVGGDGLRNYTSIQIAINAASEGDTIFVYPGSYNESIVVNKTINLVGKHKNRTILDNHGNEYYAILIKANRVNISGLTIQNSTIGIYVSGFENSSNNTITNNNIASNTGGVYLDNHTNNNLISGNTITKNKGEGIRLFGSFNNQINGNKIIGNSGYGVVLWELSTNNLISQNAVLDNGRGISLRRYCDNNIVSKNNVTNNSMAGVYLEYAFNNNVTRNNIANNSYGIFLQDSPENTITANRITGNHHGIHLCDSSNNTIVSDNIFSENNDDIWNGSRTFKTPGFGLILIAYGILSALLWKRVKLRCR